LPAVNGPVSIFRMSETEDPGESSPLASDGSVRPCLIELIPGEHCIVFFGADPPDEDAIEDLRILAYKCRNKDTLSVAGDAQVVPTIAEAIVSGVATNFVWQEYKAARRYLARLRDRHQGERREGGAEAAELAGRAIRLVAPGATPDLTVSWPTDSGPWQVSYRTADGKPARVQVVAEHDLAEVMIGPHRRSEAAPEAVGAAPATTAPAARSEQADGRSGDADSESEPAQDASGQPPAGHPHRPYGELLWLRSAAGPLRDLAALTPTGIGAVCYRAPTKRRGFRKRVPDERFRAVYETVTAKLRSQGPVEDITDNYGFSWIVIHRPPGRFDELLASLQHVMSALADSGYDQWMLTTLVTFGGNRQANVGMVYLTKRNTFYAFAPLPGPRRDNTLELAIRGAVGQILPIEPDLSRWMPIWGAPGL
jgi:hypothetical protein